MYIFKQLNTKEMMMMKIIIIIIIIIIIVITKYYSLVPLAFLLNFLKNVAEEMQ
jgi:hypothetical protein